MQVEQKYNKLRRPYYEKRNDIIGRIPKFWLTAFINHPQISGVIDEEEEDCLQHLCKLEVEEYEDIKSGYRIKMHFDAANNPYFDNAVITKEIQLGTEIAGRLNHVSFKRESFVDPPFVVRWRRRRARLDEHDHPVEGGQGSGLQGCDEGRRGRSRRLHQAGS